MRIGPLELLDGARQADLLVGIEHREGMMRKGDAGRRRKGGADSEYGKLVSHVISSVRPRLPIARSSGIDSFHFLSSILIHFKAAALRHFGHCGPMTSISNEPSLGVGRPPPPRGLLGSGSADIR